MTLRRRASTCYQNLIVGKQSYRQVVMKNPQVALPVATLLHHTTTEARYNGAGNTLTEDGVAVV